MRVNVYAEEITDRIEIISKEIEGQIFTGVRFYLELPVTIQSRNPTHRSVKGGEVLGPLVKPAQVAGPFMHTPWDDDSSAITFWGKKDLQELLRKALDLLDKHYNEDICI